MKYFLNLFTGGSVKEGFVIDTLVAPLNTIKTTLQTHVEGNPPTATEVSALNDDLGVAISAIETASANAQSVANDAAATAEDYLGASRFHSKRLAQNSRYYEKRYEDYRNTAQIVLIATIIFVIISLISSYGIIPSSISTVLVPLMVGCFVFYLAYLYFDIAMRTQTDYDEYNFNRPGMDDRDNVGNE